jgi:hypothetical protein
VAIPADIRPAIIKQLAVAYGKQWDQKNHCMLFSDESANYCVRIVDLHKTTTSTTAQYFLTTAGDAYDSDGGFDSLGRAQSGIMGLFLFEKLNHDWSLVAGTKAILSGQWGSSQAENYKIKPIGSQQYGWVGEETGSGAGGESSTSWNIYSKLGQQIKQIAQFEVAHSYMGSYLLDKKVTVRFLTDQSKAHFYPLEARFEQVNTPIGEDGEPIEAKQKVKKSTKVIYFDQDKQVYSDPFGD